MDRLVGWRFAYRRYLVREYWHRFWHETAPRTIANALPKRIIYWCLIRAWVFSLSGKYAHVTADEVRTSQTVRRWDEQDH